MAHQVLLLAIVAHGGDDFILSVEEVRALAANLSLEDELRSCDMITAVFLRLCADGRTMRQRNNRMFDIFGYSNVIACIPALRV